MTNLQLALATNNPGKKKELEEILKSFSIQVFTPKDLGLGFDPEETESTFIGNSMLKAREMHRLSGLPSLADDSGICVEALGGRPGVYSARYGGETVKTDRERAELLLKELGTNQIRRANYSCAISYVAQGIEKTFDGHVWGEIASDYDEDFKFGFGYDPIFYYPPLGARFSQIPPEQKNQVSHRKLALDAFLKWFSQRNID